MKQQHMKQAFIFFMIGAILVFSVAPTATAEKANCDAAYLKCMLAYTMIFGIAGATTLCTAGFIWCLQFMN